MLKFLTFLTFGIVAAMSSGCRSVPSRITTTPSRAVIILNDRVLGIAPLSTPLPRLNNSKRVNTIVAIKHKYDFGLQLLSSQSLGNHVATNIPEQIHFALLPRRRPLDAPNFSGNPDALLGVKAPDRAQFTSTPPGAAIVLNGRLVGVTPCSAKIPALKNADIVNTVVALKEGFGAEVRVFSRRYIDDRVYSCIPPSLHFDLVAIPSEGQE